MLKRLPAAALVASVLVLSARAEAESAAVVKPQLRRDPHGIKGISPFAETLKRGDAALLARDVEGAIAAYRDAIAQEPSNALGQYRLGEAQLMKGELHEAEQAFSAGLRVVAANLGLKAKLQFALADLGERQKAYDDASAKWIEYETFTAGQKEALGFPASGTERKKVLETWKKLSVDSLAVKARIEKGMHAADEAIRKSSQ